jgi:transmembrane sensor
MQPSRQSIEAFMQRLKNGDCTQYEIDLFKKWIATADFNRVEEGLQAEWLESVKSRMHQQLMQEFKGTPVVPMKRRGLLRKYVAAAAIVITMGAGMLLWYLNRRQGSSAQQTVAM